MAIQSLDCTNSKGAMRTCCSYNLQSGKKIDFFIYVSEHCTYYCGGRFACWFPFVLFRPKHDVKLLLRLRNMLSRLLNIKRKLLKQIDDITVVETIWRLIKS